MTCSLIFNIKTLKTTTGFISSSESLVFYRPFYYHDKNVSCKRRRHAYYPFNPPIPPFLRPKSFLLKSFTFVWHQKQNHLPEWQSQGHLLFPMYSFLVPVYPTINFRISEFISTFPPYNSSYNTSVQNYSTYISLYFLNSQVFEY